MYLRMTRTQGCVIYVLFFVTKNPMFDHLEAHPTFSDTPISAPNVS